MNATIYATNNTTNVTVVNNKTGHSRTYNTYILTPASRARLQALLARCECEIVGTRHNGNFKRFWYWQG
jgi:hypothetical protein